MSCHDFTSPVARLRRSVCRGAAAGVALNVTVVTPTDSGFLTVFPKGTAPPTASTLNYTAGQIVPNGTLVKVGADRILMGSDFPVGETDPVGFLKQGRAIFGVEMEIVGDDGQPQPHDGVAYGDLMVKGPWVIREYFKGEGGNPLRDGWFPTGDVGTIDADGYLQITDRSKDVIKSGGEWISSIDIENIAMAHPAVAMAACVGIRHPKWDERPIVVVVKKTGMEVTRDELLAFYQGKTAKWQIPDDVVFVDAIPLGATGKMLKTELRKKLADYTLPGL